MGRENAYKTSETLCFWGFSCVPGMALIILVKAQSRVFTAKCSEPQVDISNGYPEEV